MNRKWLFIIILVLIIITIGIIFILTREIRYNKLVIDDANWNEIINNRNDSTNIMIENIKFNDYEMVVDNESNVIYYSVIEIKNKYNPKIEYDFNDNLKLVINKRMEENIDSLKIMIYNDVSYRIYTLSITNLPILNINYLKSNIGNIKEVEIELFDNRIKSTQKYLKSIGRLIIKNNEYELLLKKESLGHNKRENKISILGMDKRGEYILKKVDNEKNKNSINVFINNKYIGIYTINLKGGMINDGRK